MKEKIQKIIENKVKLLKLKSIIFNHSSNYEEEIKEK